MADLMDTQATNSQDESVMHLTTPPTEVFPAHCLHIYAICVSSHSTQFFLLNQNIERHYDCKFLNAIQVTIPTNLLLSSGFSTCAMAAALLQKHQIM